MENTSAQSAPKRTLQRKLRETQQDALFDVGSAWEDLWWGMPSYVMGDARPCYRITVNIFTLEDLKEFGERIGYRVTTKTDTMCFPKQELDQPSAWIYSDEA